MGKTNQAAPALYWSLAPWACLGGLLGTGYQQIPRVYYRNFSYAVIQDFIHSFFHLKSLHMTIMVSFPLLEDTILIHSLQENNCTRKLDPLLQVRILMWVCKVNWLASHCNTFQGKQISTQDLLIPKSLLFLCSCDDQLRRHSYRIFGVEAPWGC
jgi:hypothetical protein